MDKKLGIILGCGIIIFVVYLYLDNDTNISKSEKKVNLEKFNNNIVTDKPSFDPYTFYTQNNKLDREDKQIKYTKENFDFDYETDFKYNELFLDKNLESQSVSNLSKLKKTATYLKTEPIPLEINDRSPNWTTYDNKYDDEFLIPNELESNSIYSMPFPENTSIELGNFTAENVANLYDADNMEDLYNTINADMFKGYKTLKYML
jgi:hypothetical protein